MSSVSNENLDHFMLLPPDELGKILQKRRLVKEVEILENLCNEALKKEEIKRNSRENNSKVSLEEESWQEASEAVNILRHELFDFKLEKKVFQEAKRYTEEYDKDLDNRIKEYENSLKELGVYDAIIQLKVVLRRNYFDEKKRIEKLASLINQFRLNIEYKDKQTKLEIFINSHLKELSAILSNLILTSEQIVDHFYGHLLLSIDSLLLHTSEKIKEDLSSLEKAIEICDDYRTALNQKSTHFDTKAKKEMTRERLRVLNPIQYGYNDLQIYLDYVEDKTVVMENKLYIYLRYEQHYPKVYCAARDKNGHVEHFEIPENTLEEYGKSIPIGIKYKQLSYEQEKKIFSVVTELKGDKYKLTNQERLTLLAKLEKKVSEPQDKEELTFSESILSSRWSEAKCYSQKAEEIINKLHTIRERGNIYTNKKASDNFERFSSILVDKYLNNQEKLSLVLPLYREIEFLQKGYVENFKKRVNLLGQFLLQGYQSVSRMVHQLFYIFHKKEYTRVTLNDSDDIYSVQKECSDIWKEVLLGVKALNNLVNKEPNNTKLTKELKNEIKGVYSMKDLYAIEAKNQHDRSDVSDLKNENHLSIQPVFG